MDKLIEKLGTYQILANLLPGAFFCLALRYVLDVQLPVTNSTIENFLTYYFAGFFIARFSSLLSKFLIYVKFIKHESYTLYVKAEKNDPKLIPMVEVSSFIRSMFAGSLLLIVIYAVQKLPVEWSHISWNLPAILVLAGLLLYAYRRQEWFIRERVIKETDSIDE